MAALAKEGAAAAAYESGCFGFELLLTNLEVAAIVAAAGLIRRKPSVRCSAYARRMQTTIDRITAKTFAPTETRMDAGVFRPLRLDSIVTPK